MVLKYQQATPLDSTGMPLWLGLNLVNIFVSRKKRENQNLLDSGNRDNNFPVDAALVELEALAAGPPMAIFPAASRCFGQDSPCIWLSDLVDDDNA